MGQKSWEGDSGTKETRGVKGNEHRCRDGGGGSSTTSYCSDGVPIGPHRSPYTAPHHVTLVKRDEEACPPADAAN